MLLPTIQYTCTLGSKAVSLKENAKISAKDGVIEGHQKSKEHLEKLREVRHDLKLDLKL